MARKGEQNGDFEGYGVRSRRRGNGVALSPLGADTVHKLWTLPTNAPVSLFLHQKPVV